MDYAELLVKVDLALGKPIDYSNVHRAFTAFNVLAPTGYEFCDVIFNYYEPDSIALWNDTIGGCSVLLHGHRKGVHCSGPYFCHVWGYRPTGTENPKFIKLFNMKWRYLYDS